MLGLDRLLEKRWDELVKEHCSSKLTGQKAKTKRPTVGFLIGLTGIGAAAASGNQLVVYLPICQLPDSTSDDVDVCSDLQAHSRAIQTSVWVVLDVTPPKPVATPTSTHPEFFKATPMPPDF